MANGTAPTKYYRIKDDGYYYGMFRKQGELIELNEKQSKYLLMDKNIEPVVPPVKGGK